MRQGRPGSPCEVVYYDSEKQTRDVLFTGNRWGARRFLDELRAGIGDARGERIAEAYTERGAAFIVRAVNTHAQLVEALDSLEASAVNLHCALQSTAHMDHADSRIPVITGQVVRDLLAMRDQARAALASAQS